MRRLLLTGASGFIGTNLLENWKGRYEAILNLDSRPPLDATHQSFWHKADLLAPGEWTRQLADFQPTEVIHLESASRLYAKRIGEWRPKGVGNQDSVWPHTAPSSSREDWCR